MGERKIILKVSLGLAAGLVSALIIYALNRGGLYFFWSPLLAAGLIGAVTGIAEKSIGKIVLGVVLGCAGWISGELFSLLLFHSVATWMFVGGFIGLTGGIVEKSFKSMAVGIILGAIGGLIGVVAGMLTISSGPLGGLDMQATSIVVSAICIHLMLGLKRPRIADAVVATGNEDNNS